MSKVSILICTYGDPAWADLAYRRALPSTSGQCAHETQVVHLDDGSLAVSRNTAAAAATGDWLCFLDADDELGVNYLNAMRPHLDHPYRLLVPAVEYLDRNGRSTGRPGIPQLGCWPELNECVIGTLISRSLFLGLGGFREYASLEDYDLWLRAYDHGAQLHHVPHAVYKAHPSGGRNHDQSPYQQIWANHLERIA